MYWQADATKEDIKRVAREKVCAAEIWCECFGGDMRTMKKSDAAEINGVLSRIPGWVRAANGIRIGAEYGLQRGFNKAK